MEDNFSRIFVAITLPDPLKTRLAALGAEFPSLKWSSPETMHLTLRFIGPVPPETLAGVRGTLSAISATQFSLEAAALGLFARGRGGVLWAGVQPHDALHDLKRRIDAALAAEAALPPTDDRFSPHITLSRLKTTPTQELKRLVQAKQGAMFGAFPVRAFTLFESVLLSTGAAHTALETYALQAKT